MRLLASSEVARRILYTGTALSLIAWVRLCQAKNADPASLLQLFVDNRFLQVADRLVSASSSSSSSASSSSSLSSSPFSPTSPCLEFGPCCFFDNLRLLKHLLPGETLECNLCHLVALGKAWCCGNATCTAVFHTACALNKGLLLSSSTSSSDTVDGFAEQQTSVCPACGGRWRGVRAVRAAPPDVVHQTRAAAAAASAAAGEAPATAPGAVAAEEASAAALAEATAARGEAPAAATDAGVAPSPTIPAAGEAAGRSVRNSEVTACKTEVKGEDGEGERGEEEEESKRAVLLMRRRKRRLSDDTPQRSGKSRRRAGKRG